MSRLSARVERLERRTLAGTCPHRPPLVRYADDCHPAHRVGPDVPCLCGRPRLVVTVEHVPDWHAQDVDDAAPEEPDGGA